MGIHQIISIGGAGAPGGITSGGSTTNPPSLNTNTPGVSTNPPSVTQLPVSVLVGTNSPNGHVAAGYGSVYNQFDGTGTNYVATWIKQTATGSTNWVAQYNPGNVTYANGQAIPNPLGLVYPDGHQAAAVANGADNLYANWAFISQGVVGPVGASNIVGSLPIGQVSGAGNAATATTNSIIAYAVQQAGTNNPSGWQTAANVSAAIGSASIAAANVSGLGNAATADTNNIIANAVQRAGTNNPSGWQTVANAGALIFTSAPALTSPYVNSFVASNNIIDQKAIQDLSGYFAYLNKQGIASNLVDALALRQRWHPDVSLTSVKGNSFTWPNPSYEPGGYAQINAGSTITYQLPTLLSNFTVVITYHRPAGGTHNKSGTLFRFSDTNTYSSFYVSEVNGQHWCMENNGTNFYPPFNYTLAYNGTNYGTNTFYPPWIEGYANLGAENGRENPRMCERRAITLVHMANGTEFSYQDGLTNGYSYFGTWGSNFKYQSPTVSPVPFNTLTIGQEVTNTVQRMNYFSPYDDYTNFAVSSIQIFNSTNLNQIWPETEASWWFEDEDYYDQFVGDSRQQPIISPTTNSYPFFYEYGRSGGTYWGYANYSQGGTTAQQYETTWAAAGGIGTITNLPPEKIRKIDLWYRFGDNDIRNGATVANAYSYISNGVAQVLGTARPVTVHFMDGWQFSTNVSSFSLTYETNVLALNNMVATNQPPLPVQFHQLYPYITQNLLNTNNGYSGEGIHFNTTNTVVYKAIASWMLTGVWNASFLPAFQSIPH